MPDLSIEKNKNNLNYKLIAGVDEAGRGPWAGPVYSAAVILDISKIPADINDSKKMSEKKRDEIYSRIVSEHHYSIGVADVNEIDELNILQASLLSMKRAITNLHLNPDFVLIDGVHRPNLDIDSENIIKGDSKSLSIAAASIIAKVERDRFMKKIDEEYPCYNWKKNKGYGTKEHQNALNIHGISKHHRKSFSPIRKILSLS
ncbi:MAG: ribonuclease HII [Pseudomonadota bacterium]|nr:ribonuclease HII [Pseudomonadota bacterium]